MKRECVKVDPVTNRHSLFFFFSFFCFLAGSIEISNQFINFHYRPSFISFIIFSLPDIETATGKGNSVTQADTLWIYGDSVNQRFLNSLKSRGICQENFKKCISSYMWIYEVGIEVYVRPRKFDIDADWKQ